MGGWGLCFFGVCVFCVRVIFHPHTEHKRGTTWMSFLRLLGVVGGYGSMGVWVQNGDVVMSRNGMCSECGPYVWWYESCFFFGVGVSV